MPGPDFSLVNDEGREKTLASTVHVLIVNDWETSNLCNSLGNPLIVSLLLNFYRVANTSKLQHFNALILII